MPGDRLNSYFIKKMIEDVLKQNAEGTQYLLIDNTEVNDSKPFIITGNISQTAISVASDEKIYIKGMVISGTGTQGTGYIKRSRNGGEVILPTYFSQFSRGTTTGALNIELEAGEDILIETVNRASDDETFFGLTINKVNV